MNQPILILSSELTKERIKKFELLFSLIQINEPYYSRGRPPHLKSALLNALIYKNLRGIPTLLDLTRELESNPAITQLCGFKSFPSIERFFHLLRTTPNEFFKTIRETLIHQLISLGLIKGQYISCDSCPIFVKVKENNLKTNVKDRYDKTKILKGDPTAKLGAYVVYPNEKDVSFFWGYRNHMLNDAISELPVAEKTYPNTVSDSTVFIPQLKYLADTFKFKISAS